MVDRRSRPAARPFLAALGALALAGCSATHVGDDWQCPLAQGKVCASVAAADPAVPETRSTADPVDDAPLYRRSDGRIAADTSAGRTDEPACDSECHPFAWLGSLFSGIADAGSPEPGPVDSPRNGDVATAAGGTSARPDGNPAAPAGQSAPVISEAGSTAITPAVSGDAPRSITDEAGDDTRAHDASDPVGDGAFRTGEVVARIWIAPFVDADGIYREGSWVRAVIAPAQWRLP